jgi:hypothetical protein
MGKNQTKLTELGKKLYDAKAEKDQLEERLKVVNAIKSELEKVLLPKAMEDAEQDKFSIAGMGTFYLQADVQVYIKNEQEDAAFKWFRKEGHGDIIKETIHPGTLKSWTKEQLENGGKLPPGMNAHQFMRAVMRRK